jgi:hypothetical protein
VYNSIRSACVAIQDDRKEFSCLAWRFSGIACQSFNISYLGHFFLWLRGNTFQVGLISGVFTSKTVCS